MGTIHGRPNPDTGVLTISTSGGDSGSPVFSYNSQGGLNLYGMIKGNSGGSLAYYHPWDYIQTNIGAIPAP